MLNIVSCPRLKELDLSSVWDVTDDSLIAVSHACPLLECIEVEVLLKGS